MSTVTVSSVAVYALRLADDCFILSHQLAEWSSRAPTLEEDVALTNIALDLLGQARALFEHVSSLDGSGRCEDDYAFMRDERHFVNCLLVEQGNGDFAMTTVRQLLFSAYQLPLWNALSSSRDEQLAAIAAKAAKEAAYHLDHAAEWTLRLGDGTDESHRRMRAAVDTLWPYCGELFEEDEITREVARTGAGPESGSIRVAWEERVVGTLTAATLDVPSTAWRPTGGRQGLHTEHFGYMLAEMQHLHRSFPGVRW